MAFARDVVEAGIAGARVVVRAKPKAGKAGVSVKAGVVVVAVTAVAEGGKANAAVRDAVADVLGVARSRVMIVRGETAREKDLFIAGVSAVDVDAALAAVTLAG